MGLSKLNIIFANIITNKEKNDEVKYTYIKFN